MLKNILCKTLYVKLTFVVTSDMEKCNDLLVRVCVCVCVNLTWNIETVMECMLSENRAEWLKRKVENS